MFMYCESIEDGYASFLTDENVLLEVPLSQIPFGVNEGDAVVAHYHNGKLYVLDKDDEDRRRRNSEILKIYEKYNINSINEREKK